MLWDDKIKLKNYKKTFFLKKKKKVVLEAIQWNYFGKLQQEV